MEAKHLGDHCYRGNWYHQANPGWCFQLLSLQGRDQTWDYTGTLMECFALRDYFFDKQSVFTAQISYDGTPIFDCNRRKSHTMMLDPQTLFLPVKK